MNLAKKKTLAANALKVGKKRIVFNKEGLPEIKEAITKEDIRTLKQEGIISLKPKKGRKKIQKRKRGTTQGSKQGRKGAREGKKEVYVKKVRALRYLLKVAKDREEITNKEFWILYKKVGGNTVRNKAHLRLLKDEMIANRKS